MGLPGGRQRRSAGSTSASAAWLALTPPANFSKYRVWPWAYPGAASAVAPALRQRRQRLCVAKIPGFARARLVFVIPAMRVRTQDDFWLRGVSGSAARADWASPAISSMRMLPFSDLSWTRGRGALAASDDLGQNASRTRCLKCRQCMCLWHQLAGSDWNLNRVDR